MKNYLIATLLAIFALSCGQATTDTTTADEQQTNASPEELIQSMIDRWNVAHNEQDMGQFSAIYASEVEFYQTKLSKNDCIEKKIKLLKKYPDFKQTIKPGATVTQQGDGSYKCTFVKEVFFDGKTKEYPSYLVVKKEEFAYKICVEGDDVTDKNLENKANTPELFITGLEKGIQATAKEAKAGIIFEPDFPTGNNKYPTQIKCREGRTFTLDLNFVTPDNKVVYVPYNFEAGYDRTQDEEMVFILETNKYVLGQHDFDNDGVPEIVFAVVDAQNKNTQELQVNILKLYKGEWKLFGNLHAVDILGDAKAVVKGGSITIFRNLNNFYFELTWQGDHFENTSDY